MIVRNKYRAKAIETSDGRFDSKAELKRWEELKLLHCAGVISKLIAHPKFDLIVNGDKVGRYTPDFSYLDRTGALTIEDVKGVLSEAASLRIRLFQAIYKLPVSLISKKIVRLRRFRRAA